jgi:hypothetical protein
MHLKYISKSFKKSLFEQMLTEHPEYKKRKDKSRERRKKRRSSSDYSDCNRFFNLVGDRTTEDRRRIIERWNIKYEKEKDDEKKKREHAEAKINFILVQQRIQENLNQSKNENKDNK